MLLEENLFSFCKIEDASAIAALEVLGSAITDLSLGRTKRLADPGLVLGFCGVQVLTMRLLQGGMGVITAVRPEFPALLRGVQLDIRGLTTLPVGCRVRAAQEAADGVVRPDGAGLPRGLEELRISHAGDSAEVILFRSFQTRIQRSFDALRARANLSGKGVRPSRPSPQAPCAHHPAPSLRQE